MPDLEQRLRDLGTDPARGLSLDQATERLRRYGANEVVERPRHPALLFLRKFTEPSAWMIELIAVLSLLLGKREDFWIAASLLLVNAILGFLQEQRASAAVAALRHRLEVSARILREGQWSVATARQVVPGDVVRVRTGDIIPADLLALDGEVAVDQSALTGESRDVAKKRGDEIPSGALVRRGEATGVVTATGAGTYLGRTTKLVDEARPKLHVEAVIARVVRWLLIIVGALVAVTLAVSLAQGLPLHETLPIALVVLMSAVPVALPVMFTVSMAVGSMELARHGVLVSRLSAIEDAASMDVLCTDKTGTLTLNRLTFAGAAPRAGSNADDVLRTGALASQEADADPIDAAFLLAARERGLLAESARMVAFEPFSAASRRTAAVVEIAGCRIRCIKGAVATVATLTGASGADVDGLQREAETAAANGARVLAVAIAEGENPLRLLGLAFLNDPLRPDSRRLIDELRALGIVVKMATGDALPVARHIASQLGLGEVARAADLRATLDAPATGASVVSGLGGYAEVFPEDKFRLVKALQAAGHMVGMTGDGVNDAPALRQAEVGIAVSGSTDVAKAAASAVLTNEGLAEAVDLVRIGRAIYQRVLTWIINKVSRTIMKSGFVVLAFLTTGRFVISALGMLLLVFMTDFVKIALATDRTRPSSAPETWNIGPLVRMGAWLGVAMLAESLAILALAWKPLGLATDSGRLECFTFELLLFFALFSVVSVRERRSWWVSRPSRVLTAAVFADALAGLAIGRLGLGSLRPLSLSEMMVIIVASAILVLGPNDVLKVLLTPRSRRG